MRRAVIVVALASHVAIAVADTPPAPDKQDARALLVSGLKLYGQKDYLGALTIFRDAYKRFPSSKLLLNIATTLAKLDKKADAANAYQRFLDAPDADKTKTAEVARVLADLDAAVGLVTVTVTPPAAAGAEIEIEGIDGDWVTAPAKLRVPPDKELVVHGRAKGYVAGQRTVRAAKGGEADITLALVAEPVAPTTTTTVVTPGGVDAHASLVAPPPRARLGVLVLGHADIANKGGAGLAGATLDVMPHLEVQAAAMFGGTAGGYVGASVPILVGRVRPLVSIGVPVFVSHGARFAVRGAAGVEFVVDRRFAVYVEVGGEHVFSPEMNVVANLLVPAAGVTARFW